MAGLLATQPRRLDPIADRLIAALLARAGTGDASTAFLRADALAGLHYLLGHVSPARALLALTSQFSSGQVVQRSPLGRRVVAECLAGLVPSWLRLAVKVTGTNEPLRQSSMRHHNNSGGGGTAAVSNGSIDTPQGLTTTSLRLCLNPTHRECLEKLVKAAALFLVDGASETR
ncbi:unnamed protein product [Protopolystoma xenopodis]|uniref:Uncharacterized protein n=1 Tax=Protopolystoma xenopodis TaxID=117903 RepID=A0A3S5FDS1_9PLAT|nr:unnamed protein product [Protopolystoma xenopodis]